MNSDLKLKNDILAELRFEPSIDENDIGVITKDGVVTLTGHVSSYAQKRAAEKAAMRVEGLKALAEEIDVNFPAGITKNDTQIAEAAVDALSWNISIPANKIKVKVENNWVYLDGEVEWKYQKDAAEKAVSPLLGVKNVINRIIIKSPIKVSEVKSQIKQALERAARIDANHIKVDAQGHEVILKGKVRSWAEREDASAAAHKAPGVWSVRNELTVEL